MPWEFSIQIKNVLARSYVLKRETFSLGAERGMSFQEVLGWEMLLTLDQNAVDFFGPFPSSLRDYPVIRFILLFNPVVLHQK